MITLKSVNKSIKSLGYDAELIKGDGYFYFIGTDVTEWEGSSVMVYRLNELSLDSWIEELRSLLIVKEK